MVELHHAIEIDSTPEKIFEALSMQKGLKGWWTADAQAKPEVESVAIFGFDNREVIFRMHIDTLVSNKTVKWTCLGEQEEWKGTKLHWEITSVGDSTSFLRLRHRNWREMTDFCASCNSSWGALMHRLKAYTEGKRPGPLWEF